MFGAKMRLATGQSPDLLGKLYSTPPDPLAIIRGRGGKRRKTLIPNRGRWSSLSLFRQIHLGEGKL